MSKKKMLMRKFGSVIGANNVFIGGVASVINTPALLAAKLLNYPSGTAFDAANIQNFTIVGSDIECYIGVDYQIAINGFANNDLITYYIDYLSCKRIVASAFFSTSGGSGGVYMKINYVHFKNVIIVETNAFNSDYGAYGLKVADFPNATTFNGVRHFFDNTLDYINIPKVTVFGSSVASNQIFLYGTINKVFANTYLQTNNAGGIEGDLVGQNVSWVLNQTIPNPITDLSIGNIYGTALQLNFTAPTGSANAIDFYEVWLNGRYYKTISASGEYITGLSLNTSYQIQVKPIDIYYNKSTSNIVAQSTESTLVYQDSIVSYYKMQDNVLDNWSINNGTATAITYEAGLVGQRAIFNGTTSKINCGNNGNLQLSSGSIVTMIKASSAGASYRGIVTKQNAYALFLNVGILGTYSWGGTTGFRTTGINLNDGLDHIVVMTFQSGVTNGTKIYLDNVLVLTTTITILNQTVSLVIGAAGDTPTQWINAKIDDSAIFNTILSVSDISDINAKLNSGQSLI